MVACFDFQGGVLKTVGRFEIITFGRSCFDYSACRPGRSPFSCLRISFCENPNVEAIEQSGYGSHIRNRQFKRIVLCINLNLK